MLAVNEWICGKNCDYFLEYLDNSIDPNFQGANRLFVLSFENNARTSYKQYFVATVEIMINKKNFFDQPVKNYLKICDNIRKIATGQGDDFITG